MQFIVVSKIISRKIVLNIAVFKTILRKMFWYTAVFKTSLRKIILELVFFTLHMMFVCFIVNCTVSVTCHTTDQVNISGLFGCTKYGNDRQLSTISRAHWVRLQLSHSHVVQLTVMFFDE